ncbi:hypothetical protein AA103581_0094 [Gluconobacter wancherniae NBRC 103581]|nr:hypothetical protein AA103581_0094 [Gluconobacter wancherniae NBRC 103581]
MPKKIFLISDLCGKWVLNQCLVISDLRQRELNMYEGQERTYQSAFCVAELAVAGVSPNEG